MRARLTKKNIILVLIGFLIGVLIFIVKVPRYHVTAPSSFNTEWGVTFSKKYAKELDLDWKEVYTALFNELGVDQIRIPVYWDDIEKQRSAIDLSDYKFMLDVATEHNVKVILVLGQRLPRWPECHTPEWTVGLISAEYEQALMNMIEVVVKSFVEYEAITLWQVENEPMVNWFGICPPPNPDLVKREIAFVRTFDDRPILITDSGELSLWNKAQSLGGDLFGITTYRITWNKWLGFIRYPFPPSFYKTKARLAGISQDKLIIAELQAEPWIPGTKSLTETSISTQFRSMSLEQFRANIAYAQSLGVSDAYLWGAEWWYWLKEKGDDTVWNEAKSLWVQ
jgi:hypothetical protein